MKAHSKTNHLAVISACSLFFSLGCASLHPDRPSTCARVSLDPSPLWTASAVWNQTGDRLLLVDPDTRSLVAYSRLGTVEQRIALDALGELDFSTPIRLQRDRAGLVLGDSSSLLWFDQALNFERAERPLAAFAGEERVGQLSDFIHLDQDLYAYADLQTGKSTWQRGFMRLDASRSQLDWFQEFAIEAGGEYANYYHYEKRPYLTHWRRAVYVLRFGDPPQIHRLTREGGSQPIFSLEMDEPVEAMALHAWRGSLYLLLSQWLEGDEEAFEAPRVNENSGLNRAQLTAMQAIRQTDERRWIVLRIAARSGRQLGTFELPSTAQRLQLVPGESSWGLIEENTSPNVGKNSKTTLLTIPASWFEGQGTAGKKILGCST